MKKFLKLALFAIVAGAVAHYCKDRIVPLPEGPTEEPLHFRVTPTHTSEAEEKIPTPADDLTEVHGIGPVYSHRLTEAGIASFATLAAAEPSAVAAAAGVTAEQAEDWINQAGGLGA